MRCQILICFLDHQSHRRLSGRNKSWIVDWLWVCTLYVYRTCPSLFSASKGKYDDVIIIKQGLATFVCYTIYSLLTGVVQYVCNKASSFPSSSVQVQLLDLCVRGSCCSFTRWLLAFPGCRLWAGKRFHRYKRPKFYHIFHVCAVSRSRVESSYRKAAE
jgi:hypothetical protein